MSREVKRVPRDFDWPLHKVWIGYFLIAPPEGVSSKDVDHFERIMRGDEDYYDYNVEPPTGDAWQMWETVSEGSPISPPCESPEELARWLADNNIDDATYDEWLKVVSLGWCPSEMFLPDHGVMTGAKAVAVLENEQEVRPVDKPQVTRTERGWPAHFVGRVHCNYHRNTLLEYAGHRVIVSTIGQYMPLGSGGQIKQIGLNRYYETRVFFAAFEDPYWEIDLEIENVDSKCEVGRCDRGADNDADEMHEAVVAEIMEKMSRPDSESEGGHDAG